MGCPETRDKIRDLVPSGAISEATRAVLANALYLRAPWEEAFRPDATKNEPFWVGGKMSEDVPTMLQQRHYGYEQRNGYAALVLPYVGHLLQFVILLPDKRDGLADLERAVTRTSLPGAPNCRIATSSSTCPSSNSSRQASYEFGASFCIW